jgi:hypothetical protein
MWRGSLVRSLSRCRSLRELNPSASCLCLSLQLEAPLHLCSKVAVIPRTLSLAGIAKPSELIESDVVNLPVAAAMVPGYGLDRVSVVTAPLHWFGVVQPVPLLLFLKTDRQYLQELESSRVERLGASSLRRIIRGRFDMHTKSIGSSGYRGDCDCDGARAVTAAAAKASCIRADCRTSERSRQIVRA